MISTVEAGLEEEKEERRRKEKGKRETSDVLDVNNDVNLMPAILFMRLHVGVGDRWRRRRRGKVKILVNRCLNTTWPQKRDLREHGRTRDCRRESIAHHQRESGKWGLTAFADHLIGRNFLKLLRGRPEPEHSKEVIGSTPYIPNSEEKRHQQIPTPSPSPLCLSLRRKKTL